MTDARTSEVRAKLAPLKIIEDYIRTALELQKYGALLFL